MRIRVWGARGSLRAPLTPAELEDQIRSLFGDFTDQGLKSKKDAEKFLARLPRHRFGGYGGNTPCVEVSTSHQTLVVDGGSGIRQLGYELMRGPCGKGTGEVHLLFTHFH